MKPQQNAAPGHRLETRQKIQESVKLTLKQKKLVEMNRRRTEIDGTKLPRIRIGYKKPEPEVRKQNRPNFVPHAAKAVDLPCGRRFQTMQAAADYLGCDRSTLSYNIRRGTLDELVARLAL